MSRIKNSRPAGRTLASLLLLTSLIASLCGGAAGARTPQRRSRTSAPAPELSAQRKLTPDSDVTGAQAPRVARTLPRDADAIRSYSYGKLTPDLQKEAGRKGWNGNNRKRVILQLRGAPSAQLLSMLASAGVAVRAQHKALEVLILDVPMRLIPSLTLFREVDSVSADRELKSSGHVTATTGLDAAAATSSHEKLDATGVAIAVLDSGIDESHPSFALRGDGPSRVKLSLDFTGEGRTDDPYGHGTHVAALALGSRAVGEGEYAGLASNANILNLRVLDSRGVGTVSGVLSALEWLYANRSKHNVRVVNMSLGAPAVASYRLDPLCRAARRLVDAGVVVVAAAGNEGKDRDGVKVYGAVHSPGIEPSVITVGATNTFGTDSRADDAVTTYSSRGPTRGYWSDEQGTRHYDNLVKPEMVAPGNRLVAAKARDNYLVSTHPHLDAPRARGPRMMYMSGTSMAAPLVAGAAAVLAKANNGLTPNLVKAILMYTAQPLAGYNQFEQGAGQLNVEGAMRFAQRVRRDFAAQPLGAPLLSAYDGDGGGLKAARAVEPHTTIDGHGFGWSQTLVVNHAVLFGGELLTRCQKVYGGGIQLGDAVTESGNAQSVNRAVMTRGIMMSDQLVTSDGSPAGGGTPFLSTALLLGDGIMMSDGIMMTDGIMMSDGIMMADTHLAGDDTASMQ